MGMGWGMGIIHFTVSSSSWYVMHTTQQLNVAVQLQHSAFSNSCQRARRPPHTHTDTHTEDNWPVPNDHASHSARTAQNPTVSVASTAQDCVQPAAVTWNSPEITRTETRTWACRAIEIKRIFICSTVFSLVLYFLLLSQLLWLLFRWCTWWIAAQKRMTWPC